MVRSQKASTALTRSFAFLSFCLSIQCSDDNSSILPEPQALNSDSLSGSGCGCTYTIPENSYRIDGEALGIKPGDVLCLQAGVSYGNLVLSKIRGTADSPVVIRNCGGPVTINGADKWFGLRTEFSSFLRITGGSTDGVYGIKINAGYQSLHLDLLTTYVEADHLEIANSGFAGIMAKTEPSCDDATLRKNFIMQNVFLHHNYVHDTGGEGLYVGHTSYEEGVNTPCGIRLPPVLEGVKVYNNIVKNAGREAIQIGSTPAGAEVYNNRIENYGIQNIADQNHAVQFGDGAPGKFYGNFINEGSGNGVMILSNGENFIHDNVIVNTGGHGIFCDDRAASGPGFTIIHNTIVTPGKDGIRLYADNVPLNILFNNLIVGPKNYSVHQYPRTPVDAYIYLLSPSVKVDMRNNYFTQDISSMKFVNPPAHDYSLSSLSPVINKGTNTAGFNISVDFAQRPRLRGEAYDIGAYEY